MLKIAHRGNVYGPKPELENSPEYLDKALSLGFDIEVDVWYTDNKFLLGHDSPQYKVSEQYLQDISINSWFHCKNFSAMNMLAKKFEGFNYFWQDSDRFSLTSKGYIWTNIHEKDFSDISVLVNLSKPDQEYINSTANVFGLCHDYVGSV